MGEKLEFKKELMNQLRETSDLVKLNPDDSTAKKWREGLQKLFDICNARNRF